MREFFVGAILLGCGANNGNNSGPDETSTSASTTSPGATSDTSTETSDTSTTTSDADTTSAGETSGTPEFNVIALVEPEGSLKLSIANHNGPTCEDLSAFPPDDYQHCTLAERIWVVVVTLDPPITVPGEYETMLQGSQLSVSESEYSPNDPDLPCGVGFGGGADAMLRIDAMSATDVEGTLMVANHADLVSFPFSTPLCP